MNTYLLNLRTSRSAEPLLQLHELKDLFEKYEVLNSIDHYLMLNASIRTQNFELFKFVLQLEKGSFGVKRTTKSFSRQPIDLTLEQTINADAANKLTGVLQTRNSISARQRWCRSHIIRSTIISHTIEQMGLRKKQDVTADLQTSRIKKIQHSFTLLLME